MTEDVRVIVASPSYELTAAQRALGDVTRRVWATAIQVAGSELGMSIVLSTIGRELRRELGIEAAQTVLRQLAETMPEVAANDIKD